MAHTPPASKLRAGIDFFSDWQGTLLVGGCLTYLGGKVVLPLLGKSADAHPYLAKMNAKFITFWAFDDFARAASAGFVLYSDVKAYRDTRTNKQIREGEFDRTHNKWVHFPNDEMVRDGKSRLAWIVRRSIGTGLKMISAAVVVHEGLKSVGILESGPSAHTKAWAGGLGILGLAQDIYDLEQRKDDYQNHCLENSLRAEDAVGNRAKKADFNHAYQMNLFYTQIMKGLIIGVKAMAILSTLNEAKVGGLIGRVTNSGLAGKLVKHSEHIFNWIFIAMAANWLTQEFHVGANLKKWKEEDKKALEKYLFKDFTDSRELVRLIEATATTLLDFGVEILGNADVKTLGKFAKGFDSFLYVPVAAGRITKTYDAVTKLAKERNLREAWNTTHAVFKMIGDFGAALRFIGSFGGIAYISSRTKMFGYIKNIFSATAAAMTIFEEIWFPKKEWSKKSDDEILLSLLALTGSAGSFMLNAGGGLSSAFGHLVTPPAKGTFPPSYFNFNKLMATTSTFFANCTRAYAD